MNKRMLFLQRQKPGIPARESLDAALVAAAFDQQVSILFRDAGVEQLGSGNDDVELRALVASLPEYEVRSIYVCGASLAAHGMQTDDLLVSATVLDAAAQTELLAVQDAVLVD